MDVQKLLSQHKTILIGIDIHYTYIYIYIYIYIKWMYRNSLLPERHTAEQPRQ